MNGGTPPSMQNQENNQNGDNMTPSEKPNNGNMLDNNQNNS